MITVHETSESGVIHATIDGVEMYIPDDLGNRFRAILAEWESLGNTIPAYVPPEPVLPEVEVKMYAAAYELEINEGEIASVTAVDSSILGIAWVDVGVYEVYLNDVFLSLDYYPKVYDHDKEMFVIDKYPDYFVVGSTDSDGNPADPVKFNVEITTIG